MPDLAEMLQSKAGLSAEQASKAVQVVADYLQNNLSDDQLKSIASKVPGLSNFADRLPANLGDTVAGFLKKRD